MTNVAPASTAEEWQALLDEKFPQGAMVSPVRANGDLSGNPVFRVPVLVVVAMRGEWPLIFAVDGDHDLQLHVASWVEIDRSGHFVARAKMAPVGGARKGTWELNSWLSPMLVEGLAPFREPQRQWILEVAKSAESETQLEVDADPSEEDMADSAEPTEDMALTLTNPFRNGD